MSNPVYIVGLDIGTTKIACFVGEKVENGKIVIRGYGKTESTGVKRGMVFNIEETVNAIRRAVDMASEQSNVDIKTDDDSIILNFFADEAGDLCSADVEAYDIHRITHYFLFLFLVQTT